MKTGILFVLITLLVMPPDVWSTDKKGGDAPVVREHVLAGLQQAQQHIDDGDFTKSQKILKDLEKARLSNYEYSQVFQMLAFQAYRAEQTAPAIDYYHKILDLSDLPDFTIEQTFYSLGQLYFSMDKFEAANEALDQWFEKAQSPSLEAYELHALVLYQLKQYRQVVSKLNKAIELTGKQKKPPRESWLQMLNSVYYEQRDYESCIETVQQLLIHYPNKNYWIQLAGLYGELGQKHQQLSVLDAAHTQNLLITENELKTLAHLYIELKAPYKAAKILQVALDNKQLQPSEKHLRLLASAWRMAKETGYSIATLEQAAVQADHGNVFAELAQLYLIDQQYQKAADASQSAFEKGGVKSPGRLYTTLAIAQLKQQKFKQADQALVKARQYPSQLRMVALWERHLKELRQLSVLNGH